MDDNKRAYVSMAEKVDAYLQLKATDIAATAADVATLQTNLHNKIDETLNNDTQANLDNTGQTVAKNDERSQLLESTRRAIPYLVKYFLSVPNQRMADRIVEQDHLGAIVAGGGDGAVPVVGEADVMPPDLQELAEGLGGVDAVVDHEDAATRPRKSACHFGIIAPRLTATRG